MIYSVYNYGARSYDYYQGGEVGGTHAPIPPKSKAVPGMGVTADQAAWPLPAGARKIGSGAEARGRIARSSRSLNAMGDIQGGLEDGLLIAAGGIAIIALLMSSKKASTP